MVRCFIIHAILPTLYRNVCQKESKETVNVYFVMSTINKFDVLCNVIFYVFCLMGSNPNKQSVGISLN